MADPGQDPRGAPDLDPLWLMLDLTPGGRGTDWHPKLPCNHESPELSLRRSCGPTRAAKTTLRALADLAPSRHGPGCGEVKAIQVHYFAPRSHEVLDELGVRVRASVHF
jgi:hypothetical protein